MRLHVQAKRKSRTAEQYEAMLRLHILPAIGSRRVLDVRRVDVARLHAKLADTPNVANRCLALISSIWNWAARRDEVPFSANPARGIERNPERSHERYLTSDEIGRLGDALRLAETAGIPWSVDESKPKAKHVPKQIRRTIIDPHAAAAIRLLILTGARLQEILTARWDFVDWERGIMFLPDSKSGRKPLYLSAAALAVLDTIPRVTGNPYIIAGHGQRRRTPAEKQARKSERNTSRADLNKPRDAVARAAGFTEQVPAIDRNGKPIRDADGKPRMVERRTVRLHDLRHSFASIGAGASLGLPIIGKLLGHKQAATTARYSHLDADPMRRAADLIGGQIAATLEGRKGEVVPLDARKSAR